MKLGEHTYDISSLILHIPIAMVVAPLLATIFNLFIKDPMPYGPSVLGSGLALGFFINRKTRNRSAYLVGVFGILLLAALIAWSFHGYQNPQYYRQETNNSFWAYIHKELFTFDSNECGAGECLGQLLFMTPVISSIAYSLGAFLGLWSGAKTSSSDMRPA